MRDASIQVKGDEYDGYRNTVIISNNIVNMGILLMLCSITPPWDNLGLLGSKSSLS